MIAYDIVLALKSILCIFFQSAIKANGYRTLIEGEQVLFKITDSDKGQVAVCVTSKDGGSVKGASRKNRVKQGARKYTSLCFNCNNSGHRAKKCPYERRPNRTCHKCGSDSHIIRKCPLILCEKEKAKQLKSESNEEENIKIINSNFNKTSEQVQHTKERIIEKSLKGDTIQHSKIPEEKLKISTGKFETEGQMSSTMDTNVFQRAAKDKGSNHMSCTLQIGENLQDVFDSNNNNISNHIQTN